MKNVKKIGLALLLVAVLTAGIVVAVFANTYRGNVEKYSMLVEKAAKATAVDVKDEALLAIDKYLFEKPVDPASEGYGDVVAAHMAAKLAMVELCIDANNNAGDNVAAMIANATKACYWFKSAWLGVDTSADERYAPLAEKLTACDVAIADMLYAAVDADAITKETADAASAAADASYKAFKSFVESHYFNEDSADYIALVDQINDLTEKYNAARAARYEALVSQARLTDEEKAGSPITKYTFDSGVSVPSVSNYKGYDKNGLSLNNTYGVESQILPDGTENKYFAVHLNGALNAAGTSYMATYINPSFSGVTDKFVLEFDITSFSSIPDVGMVFQPKSGETWFTTNAKGDILANNGTVLVPQALVVGEWTHISVICEIDKMAESKLYVDYAYIGTIDTNPSGKAYIPAGLRMGNRANTKGDICIDNFVVTGCASIVDVNYTDRMSEQDRFLYLTDYMNRTNGDVETFIRVPDCITAYDEAGKLVPQFGYKDSVTGEVVYSDTVNNISDETLKAKLMAAVDAYFAYDPDEVKHDYSVGNLIKLESLVDAIEAVAKAPTDKSIDARSTAINTAVNFNSSNGAYIFKDAVEGLDYVFDTVYERLNSERDRLAQDQAIKNFVETMTNFENASSATLLQSLYDKAVTMMGEGLNAELLNVAGYETYKHHYEVTYVNAPDTIERAKKNVNSIDLISSINYLLGIYPTEDDWKLVYIENPVTDEDKANNKDYEFIESYVNLINRMIVRADYNPEYSSPELGSVDFAIQRFEGIKSYYYGILQHKHVEIINEQFELFAATSSYIEKKGIVSYIQRYLNQEDVDFVVELTCQNVLCSRNGKTYTGPVDDVAKPACPVCGEVTTSFRLTSSRPELYTILKKYTAYEAELAPQEENYEDLLAENTVYFVNIVKKFDTAITFADKLKLMDQARAFYYAMNIDTDEVKAAVATYEEIEAELQLTERDSREFMDTMLLLAAAYEDDAYYRYLVTAASLRANVDESIEGVSEAVAQYETAYNTYMKGVNDANSEITQTGISLGSFGANSGFTAVLSVILRMLFAK